MTRDSGIIYRSYYEAIGSLPEASRLALYDALMAYIFDGKELPLEGVDKVIFTLIKPNLDANYKRFENGKKGGRPSKKLPETEPKKNLTESKTKPKADQTESKAKANKELDKDKELEYNTPQTPLGGGKDPVFAEFSGMDLSFRLTEKMQEWLRYKSERREGYKPQGLRSLLCHVQRMTQQHGEEAVCTVIDLSMANNWQGIVWDKLTERKTAPQRKTTQGVDYSGECDL